MTRKPLYPVNYHVGFDLTCMVCAVLAVGGAILLYVAVSGVVG
jgi:hypothetical protein